MVSTFLKSTALGALAAAAIGATPALAQQSGSDGSAQGSTQSQQSSQSGQSGETAPDTVVATVGGTEIVNSDVTEFISTLPPQMREQPPQMLMSMALDQVILRELLLQEAQAQDLSGDERVQQIAQENAELAEEDAMVAIYLQDELSNRVSDAEIEQAYQQLQEQVSGDQSLPPLDALRPQIEQQLQRDELQTLREELVQNAEIVVYGADTAQGGSNGSGSTGNSSGSNGGSSNGQ